jgi:hypothetical protein
MIYDNVLRNMYSLSLVYKFKWFLLFFWLAIPVLFLTPLGVELGLFHPNFVWVVNSLHFIMFIATLLALMLLLSHSLDFKEFKLTKVSTSVFFDTIFVLVLSLWFIFVWNVKKNYRITQLLFLIGVPLLAYFESVSSSVVGALALIVFILGYLIFILYNSVRGVFAVCIFYAKRVSLINSVKKSWHLTHNKFWFVLCGLIFICAVSFAFFSVLSFLIALGIYQILVLFFVSAVSYKLALSFAFFVAFPIALIAFYFGFSELFYILTLEEDANKQVKVLLAKNVFKKKKITTKIIKKKPTKTTKKKTTKKKTVKKKPVRKKATKKKTTKKKRK